MNKRQFNIFILAILVLLFAGCAAPKMETKGEISAEKKYLSNLTIYPDQSGGKRYDDYSAIILTGRIVTMDKDKSGEIKILENGRIVIESEKIEYVLAQGEKLPNSIDSSNAIFFDTHGIVFPGLINAHDHIHYNTVGLWKATSKYSNRYQWPDNRSLKIEIKNAKNVLSESKYFKLEAEAVKYAEVKHLISGTTAVQGSPSGAKRFCSILIRNMDISPNFGEHKMSPYVREVTEEKDEKFEKWIEKMDNGELCALFLHIGEGTDEKVRSEFDFLKEKGLARKEVIIIHGTALKEDEIRYMAENDMTLVWSPVSNLLLYSETADIPIFVKYGVNICLGTDWSPSGGKNLLNEMKIAYEYSKAKYDGLLSHQDIVEMVTCNPADAVCWTDFAGRIKPGIYADLFVISDPGGDPFAALVNATEDDVSLVFVGGDPLYGDSLYMSTLKPGDFEYIKTTCGFTKCIDVTKQNVELGNQTLDYIINTLGTALQFDAGYMEQKFTDKEIGKYGSFEEYLDARFPGCHALTLDPLYPCMDTYYFETLRESENASLPFDIQKIYYSSPSGND